MGTIWPEKERKKYSNLLREEVKLECHPELCKPNFSLDHCSEADFSLSLTL